MGSNQMIFSMTGQEKGDLLIKVIASQVSSDLNKRAICRS